MYEFSHSVYQIVQVYTSVYMGMGRVIHAYCMQKSRRDNQVQGVSLFQT